jgi:protease I
MARVAVLLDQDFEDSELRVPVDALRRGGHDVEILGKREGATLRGKRGDEEVRVDRALSAAEPGAYDALLIPGGYSPDHLRIVPRAVAFAKAFTESQKPVAAVCHGPQILIEAGVVRGRTLTSWPSVRTDLVNAGAEWVDREVVVDKSLITSRRPEDLAAFSRALLERL